MMILADFKLKLKMLSRRVFLMIVVTFCMLLKMEIVHGIPVQQNGYLPNKVIPVKGVVSCHVNVSKQENRNTKCLTYPTNFPNVICQIALCRPELIVNIKF